MRDGKSAFDEFWKAYPRRDGPNPRSPAERKFHALVQGGVDPAMLIAAVKKLASEEAAKNNIGTRFIPQAMTWLNQHRWADHAAVASAPPLKPDLAIEDAVKIFCKTRHWSRWAGPEPGMSGCRAPPELLAKYGLMPDGRPLARNGGTSKSDAASSLAPDLAQAREPPHAMPSAPSQSNPSFHSHGGHRP